LPSSDASKTDEPIAILGPTASGKSAVAMAVASSETGRRLGIELVSIDAMQVYRGMDIGTAKPTEVERVLVRHHMIDLVDARETFAVAQFQAAYRDAMSDISRRGAAPLLVGGTGLYLRAAVDDLDIPGTWPEIRSRLEAEAEHDGPERLHRRLESLDPKAASRMEATNTRRIVRALEVVEGSGRLFSSFGPGVDEYPIATVRQVALRWDRNVLRTRIANRVRSMVESGLEDEVKNLMATGLSRTARQALGYKEVIEHLEGRVDLESAVESIVVRTCQFAIRQERWFRRDPRVTWFDVREDPVDEVAPRIIEMLA
jgi:tRNA dimethylallyltransferase